MFADYVARLLRRDWKFGLAPLKGKKTSELTNEDLAQSLTSTNGAIQQLVEEVATMNGMEVPMTHRNSLTVQHWCPGVQDLPQQFWRIDDVCAAGKSDNPLSHILPDGKVRNGFAHAFRGVVLFEGDIVIRERTPNDPVGPPIQPGQPNGGNITIINSAGDTSTITSLHLAKANSTITARVTTTPGFGPASRRPLAAGVESGFSENITVLNPFDFDISIDTYLVVGVVNNGNGVNAYLIVAVNGTFEPAYAVRNNADQTITGAATDTRITLGTEIHNLHPAATAVFTNTASEITIVDPGLYTFKWIVPLEWASGPEPDTVVEVWLEEDSFAIPGTRLAAVLEEINHPVNTISGTIDHIVAANKVYRLMIRAVDANAATVFGTTYISSAALYARLDIRKVRNS